MQLQRCSRVDRSLMLLVVEEIKFAQIRTGRRSLGSDVPAVGTEDAGHITMSR